MVTRLHSICPVHLVGPIASWNTWILKVNHWPSTSLRVAVGCQPESTDRKIACFAEMGLKRWTAMILPWVSVLHPIWMSIFISLSLSPTDDFLSYPDCFKDSYSRIDALIEVAAWERLRKIGKRGRKKVWKREAFWLAGTFNLYVWW